MQPAQILFGNEVMGFHVTSVDAGNGRRDHHQEGVQKACTSMVGN